MSIVLYGLMRDVLQQSVFITSLREDKIYCTVLERKYSTPTNFVICPPPLNYQEQYKIHQVQCKSFINRSLLQYRPIQTFHNTFSNETHEGQSGAWLWLKTETILLAPRLCFSSLKLNLFSFCCKLLKPTYFVWLLHFCYFNFEAILAFGLSVSMSCVENNKYTRTQNKENELYKYLH